MLFSILYTVGVLTSALSCAFLVRYIVRDSVIDSIERAGRERRTPLLAAIFGASSLLTSSLTLGSILHASQASAILVISFVTLFASIVCLIGFRAMALYRENLKYAL